MALSVDGILSTVVPDPQKPYRQGYTIHECYGDRIVTDRVAVPEKGWG